MMLRNWSLFVGLVGHPFQTMLEVLSSSLSLNFDVAWISCMNSVSPCDVLFNNDRIIGVCWMVVRKLLSDNRVQQY